MSAPEIREIPPDEFITHEVNHYAFGATPSARNLDEARDRLKYMTESAPFGVFVDGQPQATMVLGSFTQNVRGAVLPMRGVGGVASLPAGRRKGYVRALMAHGFEWMHEREVPITSLYPFRESFYERLGYAAFPTPRYTSFAPSDLAPLLRLPMAASVEQMDMKDGFEVWRAFLEQYQAGQHGFALAALSRALGNRDHNTSWTAFAREGDEITGAMTFRITGYTEDLIVPTFYTQTVAARYALLEWLARHVDQVKRVRMHIAPDDYPELWLRDLAPETSTKDDELWPSPMGRVLSIAGLRGIPAGEGTITVQLIDDHGPWNTGTWTLSGEGGVLDVTVSTAAPDCTLTIQGLSALVFSVQDPLVFTLRGWGDVDADAARTLRSIFPTWVPMLHEQF